MHARPRVSPRAAFEGESPIPLSTRSVAVDNTIFPNSTQHNINKPSRFRGGEKGRRAPAFRPFAFTHYGPGRSPLRGSGRRAGAERAAAGRSPSPGPREKQGWRGRDAASMPIRAPPAARRG